VFGRCTTFFCSEKKKRDCIDRHLRKNKNLGRQKEPGESKPAFTVAIFGDVGEGEKNFSGVSHWRGTPSQPEEKKRRGKGCETWTRDQ